MLGVPSYPPVVWWPWRPVPAPTTGLARGLSAIIVEQHPKASLAVSDQAAILDHGTVVQSGKVQSLLEPPELLDRWLGVLR